MATRRIYVGGVPIGGGAPVTVQSMTNTRTEDIEATCAQIAAMRQAGCDIVRTAVPNAQAARALKEIVRRCGCPVVADIHFDYKLALQAAEAGAAKIRINPGNIGSAEKVRMVADACRERGLPIRIGVNGGSLEKDLLSRYGLTAEAMYESAMRHVRLLEQAAFTDICISVKASDVRLCVAAYRLMAQKTDFPLHIGVTEAGTEYAGIIRSAAGIGALLCDGIGDTIRISLTADPVRECMAGNELLRALGLRKNGVRIVSCPTCGRTRIDLIDIAQAVEKRLAGIDRDVTVAVMGCAVNGPGEAREADFGMAGGNREGLLFRKGEIVGKVPMDRIVDALCAMVEEG